MRRILTSNRKQNSLSLFFFGLPLLLLCLIEESLAICPVGQAETVVSGKIVWKPCPENWISWFIDSKNEAVCQFWVRGFFYDRAANKCSKWVDNCSYWIGNGASKWIEPNAGTYFNKETNTLEACPEGCQACDNQKNWIAWQPHYFETIRIDEKKNQVMKDGHPLVEWSKWGDNQCLFCQKDLFNVLKCNYCDQNYGLGRFDSACHPCKEGCISWSQDDQFWTYCSMNYQKNFITGACDKIPSPNCANYDFSTNECKYWDFGMMVSPDNSAKCSECSSINELWSQWKSLIGKDGLKKLQWDSCAIGHFPEKTTNKWKACSENWNFWNNNLYWYSCKPGFFTDLNGKWVENKIESCLNAKSSTECYTCEDGYYLDSLTKTCKKCHDSCLTWTGPDNSEWISCGVDMLQIITPNNDTNFHYITKRSCLKTCPNVDADGAKLGPDYFTRSCTKEAHVEPVSKYKFTRSVGEFSPRSIYLDSFDYLVQLRNFWDQNIKSYRNWAALNPEVAKKYSPTCSYKGLLKQQYSADRETFYV